MCARIKQYFWNPKNLEQKYSIIYTERYTAHIIYTHIEKISIIHIYIHYYRENLDWHRSLVWGSLRLTPIIKCGPDSVVDQYTQILVACKLMAMTGQWGFCTPVLSLWIITLMPNFDSENMRIMGHALRIIGTILRNYRWNFENLRIALWAKTR